MMFAIRFAIVNAWACVQPCRIVAFRFSCLRPGGSLGFCLKKEHIVLNLLNPIHISRDLTTLLLRLAS